MSRFTDEKGSVIASDVRCSKSCTHAVDEIDVPINCDGFTGLPKLEADRIYEMEREQQQITQSAVKSARDNYER